jgi:hypothetical protein
MPDANNGGTQFDLGGLSKVGAASAALAYATGTLTINIYLHQLGITDFSFAKPKLILTGILVLIMFVLLALLPAFVAWRMAGPHGLEGRTLPFSIGIVFWLLFPAVGLITASAYLCLQDPTGVGQIAVWEVWKLLKERNWLNKGWTTLLIAAEVYVPVWAAVISAFFAVRLFGSAKAGAGGSRIPPEKVYFPLVTALAVVSVIGYIYAFSLIFYPAIPQAFGGGQPYIESFVIGEEGRCQLQQLGIRFHEKRPNLTQSFPVLHESDALVAVWLDKQKEDDHQNWHSVVVQLPKTQISATMADPREGNMPKLTLPLVPCVPSSSSGETHGQAQ